MGVIWKFHKYNADAEKVFDELQSIKNCTPQNIVEYAKDESTELHKCFTWDDTIAAEKWRRQEARLVVCHIVYTKDEETKEPSLVRVMYKDNENDEYKPTTLIVRKKDEYETLLERAYAELRAFKSKYEMLSELDEILALID